jgi:8-oxo-dGTP diphosphatase
MQEYVAGFLFSEDKTRVALIQKRQPAWQAGRLNGIGGKIEADETALEAMVREFAEETGVTTTVAIWQPFVLIEGEGFCVHFFFGVSDLVEHVRTVEAEEVAIYSVDPLPEKVLHNLRWLIPMALDEKLEFSEVVRVREK